ncbi:MAG TPA: restriction endonuclease subunit S, partial [Fimbriimonas sp.]|nr:restriction endonuclease subunit S [Fimbriimonas sp.]
RLVDCVTYQKGFAFKSADYRPSGHPIVRVSNFTDRSIDMADCSCLDYDAVQEYNAYKLRHRDAVIATVGSWPTNPASVVGKTIYVPEEADAALLNQNAVRLRSKPNLDQRFLFYLLKQPDFQSYIVGTAQGSASQASITLNDIFGFEFQRPPLAEQKAIAKILGDLDDKIELNRMMNTTLEAMARALFQSWFVDFDPVRAKLDGREPEGMDKETAALLPRHFEHSANGLIPAGWCLVAIQDVSDVNTWTLSKKDALATLEYIEISEVSRGNIANVSTYVRGEEPSRARRRLRHGDTVLSTVRPDRGSYFLALNPPENRVVSTGFAVLTPSNIPWSFLHAALTQPEVSEHLGHLADGGAYPAVDTEIIGAIQIPLPSELKILEAYHRICAPLFEQAAANRIQTNTLATLRDTLLPKLMSGELRASSLHSL